MNKTTLSILALTTLVAQATVSVSGGLVTGLTDDTGALLPPDANVLVFLVIDTGGDGFSLLEEGSFTNNSFIGSDGNDFLATVDFSSPSFFNTNAAEAAGSFTNQITSADDANSPISLGDEFILYWFPDLENTDSLTAGDSYGEIRSTDWVLPSADGATTNATGFFNNVAANATFNSVQPIPEPSSTALLGLGGFALLARRRRA